MKKIGDFANSGILRGENGKFSAENAKFRVVIGGKMTFCLFAF